MTKDDKRQRLIDAAYKVFARKGFNNASIKDIAREAEITPGLVHYYFKSKEELLISVQNSIQKSYQQQYAGKEARELKLQETLEEIKSRVENDPDWYRWRYELFSLGLKDENLQEELALILENGRKSLSVPMKQHTEMTGKEDQLAAILLACFDGLALQKMADKDFDLDGAYQSLMEMLEIYFRK
ncbi:TetR/AcrR family transcriptional regulator [Alkalihalobacillus sp. TS-13]|uniref:TetR/AcrR family transcriptional regulator n=1 Tax=Alkalihalobacillus sp. TS-13 TaxID=2842455 RepID=UPI001C888A7C|nr:TetR/AcrR family transcriptional regulator [Alkalihalobacillus sp. TS-13]